ncbi:MAG: efflux RND transporter periplasmic adaptor subunit [Chitinophagaceae bacterium]
MIFKKYITATNMLLSMTLLLGLSACKDGDLKDQSPPLPAEIIQAEKKNSIELTARQIKAVGIEIGTIEQKNLVAVIKASGELAVPPQNRAEVNVLMGGIITSIKVLEGQAVTKGQVVATLENPELIKVQQEYLSSKASFTYTRSEFQRQKDLGEANAGTGKNLQQVEANYYSEKAKIAGLEKQLQQLGITAISVANGNIVSSVSIRAPISGTVGHILINTGTYAETTRPLMEIIDNSQIHCDLTVYEKDLFKVKIGQKVNCILTNQNNQQVEGRIYGINKSFENESKGIIVHAIINDPLKYRLIPGMYVTALINVGNQQADAVPVEAIVRHEGKDYIFVVEEMTGTSASGYQKKSIDTAMHFKKIEVITGVADLGYVQVSFPENLAGKTRIVTKGAFYILSKAEAGTEEE